MSLGKLSTNNLLNFVYLMYLVIDLSLGEYENSVDLLIKLVNEQSQNDLPLISK